MGWLSDSPEHEGWTVALQLDERRGLPSDAWFRRLAYPTDPEPATVDAVQAGCDCGWRSERIPVARGAVSWEPFSAEVHDADLENRIYSLWAAHAGIGGAA